MTTATPTAEINVSAWRVQFKLWDHNKWLGEKEISGFGVCPYLPAKDDTMNFAGLFDEVPFQTGLVLDRCVTFSRDGAGLFSYWEIDLQLVSASVN